jgi:hypothetical protein
MSLSRRRLLQIAMAAPAFMAQARAQDLGSEVSLVHPGLDGRLRYVPDEQGNVIADASHAGYRGGGVAIPGVPVRETIWPVAGDNSAHIQAAIDRLAALPLDPDGLRGTLLLRAGYYRMATPLRIRASGIVLRGEGMGDTGTVLVGTGNGRAAGGGPGRGPSSLVAQAA